MANTTSVTQIQDGPSDVVYSYFFQSDGVSGELVDFVLLDPAWLTDGQSTAPYRPAGVPAGICFNLQQIWYNFSGFFGVTSFSSNAPTPIWLIAPDTDSYVDLRPMGGMVDRTPVGNFPTGKILLNTNGFTTTDCAGSLILKVRKTR